MKVQLINSIKKIFQPKIIAIWLPYIILLCLIFNSFLQNTLVASKIKTTFFSYSIFKENVTTEQASSESVNEENLVNIKIPDVADANYWEVIDTSVSPQLPTGIRFDEKEIPDQTVVRWNNYLLGINHERYISHDFGSFLSNYQAKYYSLHSQIRSIRVLNLETGETFDISLTKPIWGDIWEISSQIVNDSYYFGVGGPFGSSLEYKLSLPPQRNSKIVELEHSVGNRIEKKADLYLSKFCYEGCTYFLFDPKNSTTISLDRMNKAVNNRNYERTEEFIGIDSSGRMILNVRKVPTDNQGYQAYFPTEKIIAVSLENEQSSVTILEAADLPETIYRYFMIDEIDKILMFGKSQVYIYDLLQDEFRELAVGKSLISYLNSRELKSNYPAFIKTAELICFERDAEYSINLVDEGYSEGISEECNLASEEKSIEQMFESLDLPDNYKLLFIPRKFETYKEIRGIPQSEVPEDAEVIK